MHAAVVTSFDSPPMFKDFPKPSASRESELLVDVLATALHPRVVSQANGSHYTSTDELPLVPGIDGVGRDANGMLHYFLLPDTAMGSMSEQTVIDVRRSIVLPEGTDPVAVAAAMNPAMSSWVALRQRVNFALGQNVLVLGATGNAGALAVQIAKRFGANKIIAAGRDQTKLAGLKQLGATETVLLDGTPEDIAERLGTASVDVDVVIDYLWGETTTAAMIALVTHRDDDSRPLTWIEIGSVTGPTAEIPSAALRACRLSIVGSGQGSVSAREFLAELPELALQISGGAFQVDTVEVPLREVEAAWADSQTTAKRIVLVP